MKTKFIAFLLLVFLTGCGGDAAPQRESSSSSVSKTADAPAPARAGNDKDNSAVTTQVSLDQADKSKTETVPTERKIIRNADLQLESTSPEESQQKITSIAESKGGFVVESQQRSSNSNVTTRDTVTMTVRIPAAKFNESLDEIRKVASRVIVETVKGQDVTEEFVDIEARLKAKKALEEQFLEIMKQGKTVQDALNVQRELANVRSEIEQIEGRKRFLENQTNLSTIKILLQTPNAYSPSSSGFFYQLGNAISSGFEIALSFILGLVTFIIAVLPFVIFVVLPIFLLLRYFWRRIRTRKTTQEIIEEEIKNE
jgi:membrane-associated protease RseP (regulator of RpoE activity)